MPNLKVKPIEINWTPELSIYASEKFLKSVGDEYGWLGGFDYQGVLRCFLPYTIIHKLNFRLVRFRIETLPINKNLEIDEEKSFLNSVVDYFQARNADMIIPATTNTIFRTYPDNANAAPYGTYIIDLCQPEKTIWGNFSASHRRKVRMATKNGVQIKTGIKYLDIAYELVRETFRRSSLPFMSYDSFRKMVINLNEDIKIMIAEYHGTIQGCVVIPFSKYSAYYVYGGSISNPATGATNLLHWEAMRQLKKSGVKRYDFVGVRINPEKGSKHEGLMLYKQRFGGRLVQGYMWKYSLNPLKYSVYSLAVNILRGGDIVGCERHKLRMFEQMQKNIKKL